jgi:peptidoglycan/xylan/chitin deacetylase (PgdA/CDA1 family)
MAPPGPGPFPGGEDVARTLGQRTPLVPERLQLAERLQLEIRRHGPIVVSTLASDVLVLCYHAVSSSWRYELAVPPELLERQVGALLDRGYRPATFSRAIADPPHAKTLSVTFDDAYRSILRLGLPVLERLGAPATVFAPTGFVGSGEPMSWPEIEEWTQGEHRSELACMSWEELRELTDRGWEVGSHTRTHPHLPRLDDSSALEELEGSRRELEEGLGAPCASLAYPFGETDDRVTDLARRAGYRAAGTLTRLAHTPRPLRWPRVGVYPENPAWMFRVKTSPILRRAAALVA